MLFQSRGGEARLDRLQRLDECCSSSVF
jgi:hypothetical protein